jgi:hypothetical protein
LLFAYGLGVPLIKTLEYTGLLPWLMHNADNPAEQMMSNFGSYQPTAQDVIVCSYFKSGTNWMMQIALQIAHRGGAEYEHIHDLVPWPDAFDKRFAVPLSDPTNYNSPTGLRVIKTHLPFDKVPFTPDAHYICVVRDPKDAFVSSYHFARSVMLGPMMPSVNTWLAHFLSEKFIFGSWGKFLQAAWESRAHPNVLFLTYAEMKADLPGTVQRVADLLGVTLTAEERAAVIHKAGFDYMKDIDHKFYPGLVVPWTTQPGRMMRRGQNGGSDELLTPAQQQRIDEYWMAELRKMDSDFPYEAVFLPHPKPSLQKEKGEGEGGDEGVHLLSGQN